MGENRARIFFGTELRRKREEAGLTGKQLADALGCTPQWISTMESGRKVSEQSAQDLDTFFKTDGSFHRMWKLVNDVELQTYLPPGFAEYAAREKDASSIRVFSALLLSGLFQTPDYARAIIGADRTSGIEEMVEKRMERQAVLLRDPPPFTWFTIDETVLGRVIGSREITKGQLNFLLELGERPNIMVNVVPLNAGYHAGLGGSFQILDFNGSHIAYSESAGVGTLISQPDMVAGFAVRWDLLRGHALPVEESRAVIRTAMESL
ncbi:helix-turn-helix domain-containing protein [Actinomadura geliboluensis]|uniref:helix-turn-helix domain-containing protein n=1 Tax=Actinomadura geliboluensis TaxID=882440 RepID=UPI002615073B|nr:helix-turn-helix transcriptional regulator [Actinomadura geliboluensis]